MAWSATWLQRTLGTTACSATLLLTGLSIAPLQPLPVQAAAVNPNFLRRCQNALQDRMGKSIKLQSDTLSSYSVSNSEQGIRGRGVEGSGSNNRLFQFNCQVNVRDGRVVSLDYNYQAGGIVVSDQTRQSCQKALTNRIGQRILLSSDTLRSYFISNAQEGLRGEGTLDRAGNFRPFEFDCQVNIRTGRVERVTYNYQAASNQPEVSNALFQSCQSELRNRIGQRVQLQRSSLRPYDVSNAVQGLRGDAIAEQGRDSRAFRFDCQVNLRNNRVTRLDFDYQAAGSGLEPQFTSHQDGDRITTNGFLLTGTTRPNARVRVEVQATTAVLGGLVGLGGTRLVNREVTADRNGNFSVQVPRPVVVSSGTRYTVRASASLNGQTSPTTEITLRQQ